MTTSPPTPGPEHRLNTKETPLPGVAGFATEISTPPDTGSSDPAEQKRTVIPARPKKPAATILNVRTLPTELWPTLRDLIAEPADRLNEMDRIQREAQLKRMEALQEFDRARKEASNTPGAVIPPDSAQPQIAQPQFGLEREETWRAISHLCDERMNEARKIVCDEISTIIKPLSKARAGDVNETVQGLLEPIGLILASWSLWVRLAERNPEHRSIPGWFPKLTWSWPTTITLDIIEAINNPAILLRFAPMQPEVKPFIPH